MWALSSELPHELRRICVNIPSIPLSVDTTLTHTHTHMHTVATHTPTHCLHYLLLSPEGPRAGTTRLIAPSLGKWSSCEWRRTLDSWSLQPRILTLSIFRGNCQRIFTWQEHNFHLRDRTNENMPCFLFFSHVFGFWLVWGILTHWNECGGSRNPEFKLDTCPLCYGSDPVFSTSWILSL